MRGEREVSIFAAAMLQKLQEREHHGDWKKMNVHELWTWMHLEIEEFRGALWECLEHGGSPAEVLREGADVANLVMFLCDLVGTLEEGKVNRLADTTTEENWRELSEGGFIPAPVVSFDEEVPPNMIVEEGK